MVSMSLFFFERKKFLPKCLMVIPRPVRAALRKVAYSASGRTIWIVRCFGFLSDTDRTLGPAAAGVVSA